MKTLLDEEAIRAGVERLAAELTASRDGRPLTVVAVMTGSVVFLADLIRRLSFPLRVALVQASSYRGDATRPGELTLDLDGVPDLAGADVLVLDDIFDTGRTLDGLLKELRARGPRSLETAVLLRKTGRQEVALRPDHVVFEIPDEFVVGYGLDYDGSFRNLPFVGVPDADDLARLAAAKRPPEADEGRSS